MLKRYLPGVESHRTYKRRWLRSDAVAVLAAILVPQGMAYAELTGLPPLNGVYTTIACLVGYALAGPSKITSPLIVRGRWRWVTSTPTATPT
jgi:MFS superfamily sulfate permease-like transporter